MIKKPALFMLFLGYFSSIFSGPGLTITLRPQMQILGQKPKKQYDVIEFDFPISSNITVDMLKDKLCASYNVKWGEIYYLYIVGKKLSATGGSYIEVERLLSNNETLIEKVIDENKSNVFKFTYFR